MWQPTLLKLDHAQVRHRLAKHPVLVQILFYSLQLQAKHTRDSVGSVLVRASGDCNLCKNLRPLWIASHGNEQVWLAVHAHNCHTILEHLLHVAVTSHVRRRQDNTFASVLQHIVMTDRI